MAIRINGIKVAGNGGGGSNVSIDSTLTQAGAAADAKATGDAISNLQVNIDEAVDEHNDIKSSISDLTTKLNNFLDVDDTTTDQLSEVLTLINNNKGTLESLTTNKVNVSDIVNNLTTNVTNKPLSAAQGVALKALIDAITIPTKTSQLTNDSGFITSAPVASVNGKTGAVQLSADDVGAATMAEVNAAIETAFANIAMAEEASF